MFAGRMPYRIVCMGILTIASFAMVVAQVTVSVSPPVKNVLPGGSFTLSIMANNVAHLHAAHTVVTFNNAIVQATSHADGTFLTGAFSLYNPSTFTPATNTVTVDQAILGTNGVSGSGVLYTMTFTGVSNGTASVTISGVDLRDTTNTPIPATGVPGTVTVAYPQQTYVDPTYTQGNAGGHDFGYDAYTTLGGAIGAVNAGGTINIAPATYNETLAVTKDVTLTPMSGSPIVQNLTVNTPSVSLGGNIQVSGVLTLTSGTLATGSNAISISSNAAGAVVITAGSVNGQVDRLIAGGSTGTYLFTDANTSIRPDGSQGGISLSVRSFPGATPPNINGNPAINRYYTITPSGGLTATVRLSYLDAEINGVPEASMTLFRTTGSVWTPVTSIPNPANNYVEAPGVSEFSMWTIGDADHPLPIQLASFSGAVLGNGDVQLTWVTVSEVNNYGFYVQRKRTGDSDYQVVSGLIPGYGTTNEPHNYAYTDVAPGSGAWMYRLKQVDLNGSAYYPEPIRVNVVTSVSETGAPLTFALQQNYPNPFNPATTIEFSLAKTGYTTMKIYDILGQEVATLVDGVIEAGHRSVHWDASSLPSGMYLYKLTSGNFVQTMKLVLMK